MLNDMTKIGVWNISIHADREEEIGRGIKVTYKGKDVKGIQSLSMILVKMKADEGGILLAEDCKLREV